MRIGFLIAGAQKCGTTAVFSALSTHPDICPSNPKEVHFFDTDEFFRDTSPDYTPYHNHFKPDTLNSLYGEATPSYLYWRTTPSRIQAYNPEIKIIIILRNPVERAYSHWNMSVLKGREPLSFRKALDAESARLAASATGQCKPYSYMDRGFYSLQLARYIDAFPARNLLILRHEDLLTDFTQSHRHICKFLKISMPEEIPIPKKHNLPYKESITQADWEYLADIFYSDISRLEKQLNWNCSHWLEYPASRINITHHE